VLAGRPPGQLAATFATVRWTKGQPFEDLGSPAVVAVLGAGDRAHLF
jgi:hypothetical protein